MALDRKEAELTPLLHPGLEGAEPWGDFLWITKECRVRGSKNAFWLLYIPAEKLWTISFLASDNQSTVKKGNSTALGVQQMRDGGWRKHRQ